MEELLQIGLGLFGGLALFLYGMNLMSNNLQEAAGERMRAILAAVTKNPFFGVLAGALATAVLQSSSATTVMTIGFVAAGLMGLRQAIPIIMGANIGTTITAQIIAFKLSDYVLGIVLVGLYPGKGGVVVTRRFPGNKLLGQKIVYGLVHRLFLVFLVHCYTRLQFPSADAVFIQVVSVHFNDIQ